MEINFLIFIAITILLIYLIFKFIKKVLIAVISSIILLILLFGGVIGLAVYDVSSLTEQTEYDIQILYLNNEEYIFGNQFSIENSELKLDTVKSISKSEFEKVDLDSIKKDEGLFAITFQKATIEKLLTNDKYSLDFLQESGFPEGTETDLSKQEILTLIESTNPIDDLVNLLIEKNEISEVIAKLVVPALKVKIQLELDEVGLSLNQVLLLNALNTHITEKNLDIVTILSEYKEGKISIYPDRFSFSLVRMLPVSFIQSLIENNE